MRHCRYRLLIVESSVLARGLQALGVPGIEVLASRGYAWRPHISSGADGQPCMKAQANPDTPHREFRKALRSKAMLATDIIIATDPDVSGAFIAFCIARFLKYDARLRRGYLSQLSAAAVQHLLDTAAPLNPNTETKDTGIQALRQYFIQRQKFRSSVLHRLQTAGFSLPPGDETIALLLSIAWLHAPLTRYFLAGDGPHAAVIAGLQAPQGYPRRELRCRMSPVSASLYPPVEQPLSTAFLGEFVPARLSLESYDALQKQLNILFSAQTESRAGAISYPRTAARAWTADTWEQLTAARMHSDKQGAGGIRPPALRSLHLLQAGAGHQGLHITDFSQTPSRMRRFLKPPALALYTRIFEATHAALGYPEAIPQDRLLKDEAGRIFYTDSRARAAHIMHKQLNIRPVIPLAMLLQKLLESGWLKASSAGRIADRLCASPFLHFETGPVPHLRLNKVPAALCHIAAEVWQQAMELPPSVPSSAF